MNRKIKKELMQDVNDFLNKLEYYIEEYNEDKMTKIIVDNEIKRFFKKFEKSIDK